MIEKRNDFKGHHGPRKGIVKKAMGDVDFVDDLIVSAVDGLGRKRELHNIGGQLIGHFTPNKNHVDNK